MKTIFKFATLTAMAFAISMPGLTQQPENRVRGIVGPVQSKVNWADISIVSEIPGAALMPVLGSYTVFYLGFTAGVEADINNMVLYTTRRGSLKITAVTLLGDSSTDLTSPSVCPVVEVSANNPCIVPFLAYNRLVAPNDYYLVVFFNVDPPDNEHSTTLGVTEPVFAQSSLRGSYTSGDQSRLAVGDSIPNLDFTGPPFLLMYVTD